MFLEAKAVGNMAQLARVEMFAAEEKDHGG